MGEPHVRLRRIGWVYVVLAVGGAGGALWLAYRFGLSVPETAVALLPASAGLYLSWAALRSSRSAPAPPLSTEGLADQLAVAVRRLCTAEAGVRGLHDPRPLLAAWRAAPEPLVDEWIALVQMAQEQGTAADSDPSRWAAGPEELAGRGNQILTVFRDRVPTRRLVVLGAPGAGKTMLLSRLLLELVESRTPGAPVPVLFTLSSWDPEEQDLECYLVHCLTQDFEDLALPSVQSLGQPSRARALLEQRLVVPFLDGFDELPPRLRGPALDQINRGIPPGQGVILSSRTAEYEQAALPVSGLPRKLAGAAGIELLPVVPQEAAAYLRRDAGGAGTSSAARWDRVLGHLETGGPVARALSTPLMIFLARTIYNPRTSEPLAHVPAPDELLDMPALPDGQAAVESHLFQSFVPAAYRPRRDKPSPWSSREAERALTWMARHAERVRAGSTDLAWWQFYRAMPRWFLPVLAGVLAGAVEWIATWLIVLAGEPLPIALDERDGLPGVAWSEASSGGLVAGLVGGLAGRLPGGLIGGLLGAAGLAADLRPFYDGYTDPWMWQVLTAGLVYGFVGGLMGEHTAGLAARRATGEPPTGSRRPWNRRVAVGGAALGAAYEGAVANNRVCDSAECFGWPVALVAIVALAGFLGVAGARGARHVPRNRQAPPAAAVSWSWDRNGILIGLGIGLVAIVPSWIGGYLMQGFPEALLGDVQGTSGASLFGSAHVIGVLSVYCLVGGITSGIRTSTADLTRAPSPAALLVRDIRAFWRIGLVSALAVGLLLMLPAWYASSIRVVPGALEGWTWRDVQWVTTAPQLLRALLTGALVGIAVGLAVAWNQTACGPFMIARCCLTVRHRLPWRLAEFLADAHENRGVLRQSGAVYQFRHIELQRHLATRAHQDGA